MNSVDQGAKKFGSEDPILICEYLLHAVELQTITDWHIVAGATQQIKHLTMELFLVDGWFTKLC